MTTKTTDEAIRAALAQPEKVAVLLARVMADVQSVGKTGHNQQQNYSFRGIDAVVNAVGPALRTHGVIVLPTVEEVAYAVVEVGKQRTQMRECTVRVRYTFHGPAGDALECVSVGEAMDSGDKATPKAMSVAYRVALLQALCIPTSDPDPDEQAYERAPRQEPKPEPVWGPMGQQTLRDGFEADLRKAKTDAELQKVATRIKAAQYSDENRISPSTSDYLVKVWAECKAGLNGGEQSAGHRVAETVST